MDISDQVLALNPYHKPFAELDYLKWLRSNQKKDVHGIQTKAEYLSERFGFVKGEHFIKNPKAMDVLKYTELFYFDSYVRPYLKNSG